MQWRSGVCCSRKILKLKSCDKTSAITTRLHTDTEFILFCLQTLLHPVKIFGIMHFGRHTLALNITKPKSGESWKPNSTYMKSHLTGYWTCVLGMKKQIKTNLGSLESLKWMTLFFLYVHVQKMSKPNVIASEAGQKGQNAEGNIE